MVTISFLLHMKSKSQGCLEGVNPNKLETRNVLHFYDGAFILVKSVRIRISSIYMKTFLACFYRQFNLLSNFRSALSVLCWGLVIHLPTLISALPPNHTVVRVSWKCHVNMRVIHWNHYRNAFHNCASSSFFQTTLILSGLWFSDTWQPFFHGLHKSGV